MTAVFEVCQILQVAAEPSLSVCRSALCHRGAASGTNTPSGDYVVTDRPVIVQRRACAVEHLSGQRQLRLNMIYQTSAAPPTSSRQLRRPASARARHAPDQSPTSASSTQGRPGMARRRQGRHDCWPGLGRCTWARTMPVPSAPGCRHDIAGRHYGRPVYRECTGATTRIFAAGAGIVGFGARMALSLVLHSGGCRRTIDSAQSSCR